MNYLWPPRKRVTNNSHLNLAGVIVEPLPMYNSNNEEPGSILECHVHVVEMIRKLTWIHASRNKTFRVFVFITDTRN